MTIFQMASYLGKPIMEQFAININHLETPSKMSPT